jgi:hypothetical protein
MCARDDRRDCRSSRRPSIPNKAGYEVLDQEPDATAQSTAAAAETAATTPDEGGDNKEEAAEDAQDDTSIVVDDLDGM